jgi:hypothetical protein
MKLVPKLFKSKSKNNSHGCMDNKSVTVEAQEVEKQQTSVEDKNVTNNSWKEYRDDIDMKYDYWNKDTFNAKNDSMCQRTTTTMRKTACCYNALLNRSWHRGASAETNDSSNRQSKTIDRDNSTKVDGNSSTRKSHKRSGNNGTDTAQQRSKSTSKSKSSMMLLTSNSSSLSSTNRTNTTAILDETFSCSSNVSMFHDENTGTAGSLCDISNNSSSSSNSSIRVKSIPKQSWRVGT